MKVCRINEVSDKLLLASSNAGKIAEMEYYLKGLGIELVNLSSFSNIETPEETESTFIGNALLKARYYYKNTGIVTLADDSGICVKSLNGRPGVYSAQYGATDDEKCNRMLNELKNAFNRDADQISVLALVGDNIQEVFVGVVSGKITTEPRGTNGFGYDSIFEYEPLGKTLAELTIEEKSNISHRGRSLSRLSEQFWRRTVERVIDADFEETKKETFTLVIQINGKMVDKVEDLPTNTSTSDIKTIALSNNIVLNTLFHQNMKVSDIIIVPLRLVNIVLESN